MLEDDRANRPSWLTQPRISAHTADRLATDLPEHQLGRSMVAHNHTIQEEWPHDRKQRAGDHVDRLHHGVPIAPYTNGNA